MNSNLSTKPFEYWAHRTVPLFSKQCQTFKALYYSLKTNLITFIFRFVPYIEGFRLGLIVSIGVLGLREFRLMDFK